MNLVARSLGASTGGASGKEQQHTFIGRDGVPLNALAFGGNRTAGPADVATACNAKGGTGPMDFESETFIAHTLGAEGFDASEDGTGRGTPLIPVGYIESGNQGGGGNRGFWMPDEPSQTIQARNEPPAVAFQTRVARCGRGRPDELCPALAGADAGATSDMRPCVAYAFTERGRDGGRSLDSSEERAYALLNPGKGSRRQENNVAVGHAVRRLTPRECERLMGLPDDYTAVEFRGKPAADGPRYRAIGNSMAVPVVAWIGRRIAAVDAIAPAPGGPADE